jgi:dihydrofolate reductase
MPDIALIVAMSTNNCIGKDNKMPWHLPEDLKRFKALTLGHPVIMGRKTYESILSYLGKPLPDRKSIVLTRSKISTENDVEIKESIDEAIAVAQKTAAKNDLNEIFIIGGAEIFKQTLPMANRLYLTRIHQTIDGDAFFPALKEKDWLTMERTDYLEPVPHSFIRLERQK